MTRAAHTHGDAALRSLEVLRRHKRLIILCAVLVPIAAYVVSASREKQYTASASLLFRDPAFDQRLFGSSFLQNNQDPAREAATNVKLVSLEVVAAKTAARLNLDQKRILDEVKVASEGQSDVVSVASTDPVPKRAALIANTFAAEYVAFR